MACDVAGNLSLVYDSIDDNMQREEPKWLLSVAKTNESTFFTCEIVCDETDNLFCNLSIEKN
ncbi:hypothetical protein CS060_01590 [Anoxybacillus flavithermus]|uniref:Uncharacterized protein n=1 Tax=Anoxybacillus flavithermus TaxID=33934 RepID=A0A2G5RUA3_9BACL|nr:hypothetical protein JS80_06570 [Anoxybacillus sp. KU2-6(11)]PIC06241.1 hypothetical protein CS060_01590 [Anoxybacillus flavithermus]